MNSIAGIIIGVLILGGILFAGSKIKKTDKGFEVVEVKTYYKANILWGAGWNDHNESTDVHNTEVVAFGNGWSHSTTTDDSGMFKVEVEPNEPFKIKASTGSAWVETADELAGVAEGTTFDDRAK